MEWEKTNNPSPEHQPMSTSPTPSTSKIPAVDATNQASGGIVNDTPKLLETVVGYEPRATNTSPNNLFDKLSSKALKAANPYVARIVEGLNSKGRSPMQVSQCYEEPTEPVISTSQLDEAAQTHKVLGEERNEWLTNSLSTIEDEVCSRLVNSKPIMSTSATPLSDKETYTYLDRSLFKKLKSSESTQMEVSELYEKNDDATKKTSVLLTQRRNSFPQLDQNAAEEEASLSQ